MGRPRPYLGDDHCWHDSTTGMSSAQFLDAHDAENERITNMRLARHYEARSLFYKAVMDEMARERACG